jgi:O-antigen ligase
MVHLVICERKRRVLAHLFIVFFVFFIPLSTSLKTVFLMSSLLLIISIPDYRGRIREVLNTFWGRSSVLLFLFVGLACLWSPASYSIQFAALGKYGKLLYFPLLVAGCSNPSTRYWSINAYLAAMVLTCCVSILKSHGLLFSGSPGEVVYNYIITGFMMALASYLGALCAIQSRGWLRVLYVLVVALTSYQLFFINSGRTGYIVYSILTFLLLLEKLSIKKALGAIVLFCGLICLIYSQSAVMQSRVNDFRDDLKFLQQNNKNTSLGYRIQFYQYAKDLFKQHPFFGVGTGGYKYNFIRDNPVPAWGIATPDPHSQYWMMLSEFGFVGLFLFLVFLASLLLAAFELKETRSIVLGIWVTFFISCFSDTLFCYSTVGYLLIVFCALCFSELLDQKPLPSSNTLFGRHKAAFFRDRTVVADH